MLRQVDATRLVAALAGVWLVVMVLADLALTGSVLVLVPLFAIAPLIAAAVLPAQPTGFFAVAAVLLTVASGTWNGTWGTGQQWVRILDVTLVSLAAVVVAWVRVSREARHDRVVAIAEVAQKAILPLLPERVDRLAVSTRYLSAARDAVVGGDLYDCYHSERYTRFLVGDVRGKGLGAVEEAARVIRAFRQAAALRPTLEGVAEEMSGYLSAFYDDEEFATALLLDASDPDRLVVVSCGHPPPLLVGAEGARHLESPPGLPLGLGDTYEAVALPWSSGDRLLLYTDGLTEARDASGRFLPLLELAGLLSGGTGDEALERLLAAVRDHVPEGRLDDDLAVLLVEHLPANVEPAPWPVRQHALPLPDREAPPQSR